MLKCSVEGCAFSAVYKLDTIVARRVVHSVERDLYTTTHITDRDFYVCTVHRNYEVEVELTKEFAGENTVSVYWSDILYNMPYNVNIFNDH